MVHVERDEQLLRREELLRQRLRGVATAPGISTAPRPARPPLSHAQRQLWFLEQLLPGGAAYTVPLAYRLRGELDVTALAAAVRGVVDRHEVLRTRLVTEFGEPYQFVEPPGRFALERADLAGEADPEATARGLADAEARRVFRLAEDDPIRGSLLRLADHDHVLLLTVHHAAFDGWSLGILKEEIGAFYSAHRTGRLPDLPVLPVQYADAATRQHRELNEHTLDRQVRFWRDYLRGAPHVLEVPTDRPRPTTPSFRGDAVRFEIPTACATALRRLAGSRSATPFMALLAGYGALLSRYTGMSDLVVGAPLAGRRVEEESLIGLFANAVPIRVDLTGSPGLRDLVNRVREAAVDAFSHGDTPFERIVTELAPQRDLSRNPVVQQWFHMVNEGTHGQSSGPRLADIVVEPFTGTETTSRFDLEMHLFSDGENRPIAGKLLYTTDLYDSATMRGFVDDYVELLTVAVDTPDRPLHRLPLASPVRAASARAVPMTPAPTATVHSRFEAQVRRSPAAPAAVFGDRTLTYAELDRKANQLAWVLRAHGVGPEVAVGMCVRRGLDIPITVLAVLKAGGGFVPLDPDYPPSRLAFMLRDSGTGLVIVHPDCRDRLGDALPDDRVVVLDDTTSAGQPVEAPPSTATADSLLYVIYTSGSTGRPKGTAMHHGPQTNLMDWNRDEFAATPRALQYFPVTPDTGYFEMFSAWWSGGLVVITSEEDRLDIPRIARLVEEHRLTKVLLPVVALEHLARHVAARPAAVASLREVVVTGDRLVLSTAIRVMFSRLGEGRLLDNHYGATEPNVVTTHRLTGDPAGWPNHPPIGRPVQNTRIYVLDENQNMVPDNVVGEIVVGGRPLARGYLNRPDLTAQAFLPDPFSGEPGARMYRTGDTGRWHNGLLEFFGRRDFQIKIRGYRIEPGEIEALLKERADVADAIVVAVPSEEGDPQLVAYVVPVGTPPSSADLRKHLKSSLPQYMLPTAFVLLDQLPITGTGLKVDRARLPDVAPAESTSAPPRDELEQLVAEVWADALGRDTVGIDDDFFAMGGHSLLVTQVVHRLRDALGIDLPLRSMFESSTIAALADEIRNAEGSSTAPLVPGRREDVPLSFAQRRLWFLNELVEDSSFYNIPTALRLRGNLAVAALRTALTEIVTRHEALRTVFPSVDGQPTQVVLSPAPVTLPVVDLRAHPLERREEELRRLVEEHANEPFLLDDVPPVRPKLFRLSDDEHVLQVVMHHIVSDGLSMGIFRRELTLGYNAAVLGTRADLPTLPVQYADFALWQAQCMTPAALESHVDYWRTTLGDNPPPLELVTDRPRPRQPRYEGSVHDFVLDSHLARKLKGLSRRENVTLFMTLVAAYAVLLSRHSQDRREDIVIGVPGAGRGHPRLEPLIGFFINTLVLRVDCSADPTFRELLSRVRMAALDAYTHQDLPFEQIVELVNPGRELSHNPLFQVMFQLIQRSDEDHRLVGLESRPYVTGRPPAKFDLSLDVVDDGGQLRCSFEYSRELFDDDTAMRLAGHLEQLLRAVVADPDVPLARLTMSDEAETAWQLTALNDTHTPYRPDDTVADLVTAVARRTPSATAVIGPDGTLSYAELTARVESLARHLVRSGVGPEVRVGVRLAHGNDLVVALLAVLRAGGVYVPLDLALPAERTAYLIADAGVNLVLTRAELSGALAGTGVRALRLDSVELDTTDSPPTGPVSADGLAYILYTSGSTGRPKGVAVSHANLTNRVLWMIEKYGITARDRAAVIAPIGFDVSLWELLVPLAAGGTTVVGGPDRGVDAICDTIRDYEVTIVELVPSLLRVLLDERYRDSLSTVRHLVVGSEVFPTALLRETRACLTAEVHNSYGPTEATIDCTVWDATGDETGASVPIGHPIANTRTYVLDERIRLVPVGCVGELYVGGAGVAHGYVGRPDLTGESFVPDPFGPRAGARLYRTGDVVRRRQDGALEFLRRADDQVKLRGFRIELGEVESCCAEHPDVAAAAVTLQHVGGEEQALVGYVVPGPRPPSQDELIVFLRERLPAYMVPHAFVTVPELPRAATGKVDRTLLPPYRPPSTATSVARPTDPVERLVRQATAQVLALDDVAANADFFALGGHSLLAPTLSARLSELCGIEVPVRAVFELPRITDLAAALRRALHSGHQVVVPDGTAAADIERDILLADELVPVVHARIDHGPDVLLTGATGFVGAFLLAELLARTDGRVHCVVRPGTTESPLARLEHVLTGYGLTLPHNARRLAVVPADLANPDALCGLADDRSLAEVGTVVHCAAKVNALLGYRRLRTTNVLGTHQMLALAGRRGAALHYVSTSSATLDRTASGYALTKGVAEEVVQAAIRRGLPAHIFRLERVSGSTTTGAWTPDDLMARFVRGCLSLGTFPRLSESFAEVWTPVDAVARAMVDTMYGPEPASDKTLITAPPVYYRDILRWTGTFGRDVRVVEPMEWLALVASDPANPARPIAGLIVRAADAGEDNVATAQPGSQFVSGVTEDLYHCYLARLSSET